MSVCVVMVAVEKGSRESLAHSCIRSLPWQTTTSSPPSSSLGGFDCWTPPAGWKRVPPLAADAFAPLTKEPATNDDDDGDEELLRRRGDRRVYSSARNFTRRRNTPRWWCCYR
ncbi:hypothetical protein L596_010688 [Steinernema carpocapsae]|uniref:Uncharacterized protein n=1 Tax=Steinernema carpocapsae TaxID=34508 RepID=A0A4V6A6Y7_STECR|nr:hypothetical protein L596_010688 [Steinernema carpocapsae]